MPNFNPKFHVSVNATHLHSILVCYLSEFRKDSKNVPRHIISKHMKEMSLKSKTVSSKEMLVVNIACTRDCMLLGPWGTSI